MVYALPNEYRSCGGHGRSELNPLRLASREQEDWQWIQSAERLFTRLETRALTIETRFSRYGLQIGDSDTFAAELPSTFKIMARLYHVADLCSESTLDYSCL